MEFINHKCKHNNENNKYEDINEIWTAKGLNIWHLVIRYETATIKYCPFCGKKLKE